MKRTTLLAATSVFTISVSLACTARAQPRPIVQVLSGKQDATAGCGPSGWLLEIRNAPLAGTGGLLRSEDTYKSADTNGVVGAEYRQTGWNCGRSNARFPWSEASECCGYGVLHGQNNGYPNFQTNWRNADDAIAHFNNDPEDKLTFDKIPEGRRLIIIGHSLGAHTLLRLVAGVNGNGPELPRKPFIAVAMDPVAGPDTTFYGLRRTNNGLYNRVPGGMALFINIFQQSAPFPNNFLDSGTLSNGSDSPLLQFLTTVMKRVDGTCIEQTPGVCKNATHSTPTGEEAAGGAWYTEFVLKPNIKAELDKRIIAQLKNQGNARFMSANGGGGGEYTVDRTTPFSWETYEIFNHTAFDGELWANDQISIASTSGHLMVADSDNVVRNNRVQIGPWEKFRVVASNNYAGQLWSGGVYALKDHQGSFVCRNAANTLYRAEAGAAFPQSSDCRWQMTLKKGKINGPSL